VKLFQRESYKREGSGGGRGDTASRVSLVTLSCRSTNLALSVASDFNTTLSAVLDYLYRHGRSFIIYD
jgi:hypothetical protein